MLRKIIKNIPNAITVSRGLLGITLLPALFFSGNILGSLIAFISLGATDLIDGSLARILKAKSKFGEKADPVCDKALGITSLIIASILNPIMLIALALESPMVVVGYQRYKKEKDNVYVIKIGKIKSVSLFIATILSYLSAINPIFIPFQMGSLAITSLFQGVTLYENIKKLNEKEIEIPVVKEKEVVKEEEKENEKEKQRPLTLREKYLKIREGIDTIISLKEEKESQIGEKGFKKHR